MVKENRLVASNVLIVDVVVHSCFAVVVFCMICNEVVTNLCLTKPIVQNCI